jgi:hypothetical protein
MTAGVGRAFPLVQTAGDGLDAGRHTVGEAGHLQQCNEGFTYG